jgi:hypothetical protein
MLEKKLNEMIENLKCIYIGVEPYKNTFILKSLEENLF